MGMSCDQWMTGTVSGHPITHEANGCDTCYDEDDKTVKAVHEQCCDKSRSCAEVAGYVAGMLGGGIFMILLGLIVGGVGCCAVGNCSCFVKDAPNYGQAPAPVQAKNVQGA